jgi:hypothetical protein
MCTGKCLQCTWLNCTRILWWLSWLFQSDSYKTVGWLGVISCVSPRLSRVVLKPQDPLDPQPCNPHDPLDLWFKPLKPQINECLNHQSESCMHLGIRETSTALMLPPQWYECICVLLSCAWFVHRHHLKLHWWMYRYWSQSGWSGHGPNKNVDGF